MKHIIFLITFLCSISHSVSAMFWLPPEHFANLKCPDLGEPITKQALLHENPFWKNVAKTAEQQEKDKYLKEALLMNPYSSSLWPIQRKAIACTLAAGAFPDISVNGYGYHYFTTLERAIERNDCALIKLALVCKANPNNKFKSLLYLAKTIEATKLLIEYKADIPCRDNDNETILHTLASIEKYPTEFIAYYIQECEVNVNELDIYDDSPLMKCAQAPSCYFNKVSFNKDKFRILLEHGADPTITNGAGETVWELARLSNCLEQAQEVYKQFQHDHTTYS